MGVKQIPVYKFVKWLESIGLEPVRTTASHTYYNYPERHPNGSLSRPVTVRLNYKEIPVDHISSNLRTLGISKKEFEQAIKHF